MPHLRTRLLLILVLGMLGADVLPARALFLTYDLTGEWTGKVTCKTFAGVKSKSTTIVQMHVTQSGQQIGMVIDSPSGSRLYAGLANPSLKKPGEKGEMAVVSCGTSDDTVSGLGGELGRLIVATAKPPKTKATLKGISLCFELPNPAPLPQFGTCKWSMKRTSKVDPNVATTCEPS
ncbi:MAG: hypothetical protein B6D46_14415 [Polyangiaceae bacterium UTPRO1]|jgi:hypothetical protein|nr:hypothetical protein [Myxococcales bacterium]OQY65301.1 MAG: hypothetical protein B6D46_14415 [Polyangiaceae bacterium UTPRO1]